jgi:hypothetical protein
MKSNFQSESVWRSEAMNILIEHLGVLNTERFINSILKDQFDYTEWQRNLWKDKTVDEIHQDVAAYFAAKYPNE